MDLVKMFSYPRNDLVAGTVLFLVAVPLCLGIAIASGVDPISGLVAGIVGGIVVPLLSRSPLSVTGPAAGLTAIVLAEVSRIGLGAFFTAVALAGALQILGGLFRTGRFSSLVPSSVVKGMLAAIGITIVMKQIPVAFGVQKLADVLEPNYGALTITAISLVVLYVWPLTPLERIKFFPAALGAVLISTAVGFAFAGVPELALADTHRVSVPTGGLGSLAAALPRPDLGAALESETWIAAITIALVASLETLLSLQAMDRLDPLHRHSPPDRELIAQGAGNIISGLFGGLPMTAVIVRGGANVAAGGRERLAALFHGLLLLVAVVAAGTLLNQIPLACLAAVLIKVGLGLCRPALFREQWRLGMDQFAPFIVTIAAILYEDLLIGVLIGVVVGVLFILHENATGVFKITEADGVTSLRLLRDGTFIAKPQLQLALERIKEHGHVVIDGTGEYVDHDFKELVAAFVADSKRRGTIIEVRGIDLAGVAAGGGH